MSCVRCGICATAELAQPINAMNKRTKRPLMQDSKLEGGNTRRRADRIAPTATRAQGNVLKRIHPSRQDFHYLDEPEFFAFENEGQLLSRGIVLTLLVIR